MSFQENIEKTIQFLRKKVPWEPDIGLILGSGLGPLAEEVTEKITISYEEIPCFPVATVIGHKGCMVAGQLSGKKVLVMQGRFHYYEGYTMQEVTYPVYIMGHMNVKTLLVTNAAGGINRNFEPGDLMLITDHINLTGDNPLRGPCERESLRFPDMSEAYSKALRRLANKVAISLEMTLQEGVYAGVAGPSYETPAEINFLRAIGADAVGMSTVPEVIVANQQGINVLGISCITNMAAGVLKQKLNHKEALIIAEQVKDKFKILIKEILEEVQPN